MPVTNLIGEVNYVVGQYKCRSIADSSHEGTSAISVFSEGKTTHDMNYLKSLTWNVTDMMISWAFDTCNLYTCLNRYV